MTILITHWEHLRDELIPGEVISAIERKLYELCGKPETDDAEWGKNNAIKHVDKLRLALIETLPLYALLLDGRFVTYKIASQNTTLCARIFEATAGKVYNPKDLRSIAIAVALIHETTLVLALFPEEKLKGDLFEICYEWLEIKLPILTTIAGFPEAEEPMVQLLWFQAYLRENPEEALR